MERKRIIVGVAGGIAAYKAATVVRQLTEAGHSVRVVPTESALRFIGAATFEALSGNPVHTGVWDDVHEVPHVRIGQEADLVVVAPATADLLARAVAGRADDLLTATLLTARCPVLFAPAMHTEMWFHPATVDNVATLRRRGAIVLEPASGRLTGADSGAGRLPEAEEITTLAQLLLDRARAPPADLAGGKVLVPAGGTREPIDPVRFIGNRSSGLQGYALARTALARGARVTLVAANTTLPDPAGADVVRTGSTREMREAVLKAAADADAVVMAAAVADFRPAEYESAKIKKTAGAEPAPIPLVENPDILAEVVQAARAPGAHPQVVVGFAAETHDVLEHGRQKLARKGCDLLVVNEVGERLTFGAPDAASVILSAEGAAVDVPRGTKEALADVVWDLVAARLR